MEAVEFDLYDVDEYLKLEKTSEVRHVYVGGAMHAMSGASCRHNRISISLKEIYEGIEFGSETE